MKELKNYECDADDITLLILKRTGASPTDYFLYYSKRGTLKAVRDSQGWKLHIGVRKLFNLKDDIGEENNLYKDYPEIAAGLKQNANVLASEINSNRRILEQIIPV